PGQSVYFDEQAGSVDWTLDGPEGRIFGRSVSDEGPIELAGGNYLITIDPPGDSVGPYQFQLWDGPPPDEFTLSVGDVISPTQPGGGSGSIETPGVVDIYTFELAAPQTVYFQELAGSVDWTLTGPGGTEIFGRSVSDEGPLELEAGTYILRNDPPGDTVSTY